MQVRSAKRSVAVGRCNARPSSDDGQTARSAFRLQWMSCKRRAIASHDFRDGYAKSRSILAALMKSLLDSPPTSCVVNWIEAEL